jgi:PilZ domain-containing protein
MAIVNGSTDRAEGYDLMNGMAKTSQQKKVTQFILRPFRRIPMWCVVHYLGGEFIGKGIVTNLSQSGMRVQGDHTVTPGMQIAVRLTFAKNGSSVQIERATVRWVNGCDFGLEFVRIAPMASKQIAHVITTRVRSFNSPSYTI